MDEESDSKDRLSELPDPLLLSILSFLPTRDAVGTTLLSKRWDGLWTTAPRLSFLSVPASLHKFRNFVNGVIALWKGTTLLRFNLALRFNSDVDSWLISDIDSWLHFAIEKRVEELCLHHMHPNYYLCTEYYPPQLLYSCSSITKLTLVSCSLKIEENVKWNQLQSLVIREAESLSENALDHILCGAPRLEVLELQIMDTSHNLNIRSSSLKSLNIMRYPNQHHDDEEEEEANESMLRICAPNLVTLEISGVPCRMCLLSVPSLTNLILGFKKRDHVEDILMLRELFLSLLHVEEITLSYWCIKALFDIKKDMVVSFSNAKFLKLYADVADEILGVVEMLPGLMMLVVEGNDLIRPIYSGFNSHCNHSYSNIDEESSINKVDSLEPSPSLIHLRRVEVIWYMPDTSIFQVIESILGNAEMLEEVVFWPRMIRPSRELLSMAEEMVLSMPRASSTAKVIIRR